MTKDVNEVLHYPRLDTVLMIEEAIKNAILGKNESFYWVLLTLGIVLSLVGFTVMPWINIISGSLLNHLARVITGFLLMAVGISILLLLYPKLNSVKLKQSKERKRFVYGLAIFLIIAILVQIPLLLLVSSTLQLFSAELILGILLGIFLL